MTRSPSRYAMSILLPLALLLSLPTGWARAQAPAGAPAARPATPATARRAAPPAAVRSTPRPAATTPTAAATVKKQKKSWSAAELTFGSSIVGGKNGLAMAFLGPVFTLQGGNIRGVVGVVHLGLGAALDFGADLPSDTHANDTRELFMISLGVRFRPLAFAKGLPRKVNFWIGPLSTVMGNSEIVVLTIGAELGIGIHIGRLRLSLALHGGWADIMNQFRADRLHALWNVGGQLGAGFSF